MTQIFYNGIDCFSGIAPTPLVSQKNAFIKYGEQWGEVSKISLNGVITGNTGYFNDIISGQSGIISRFNQDYQSFQIVESGLTIVNKPYAIIRNISFPQSNYVRLLNYQIDLDCYESGFFSGVYGILEPKNEFVFTQNKDQSLNIEHNMSCRGFNTSSTNSNALQNARNYIASISGFTGQATPYFIQTCSGFSPVLIESKEAINRVQATYSVSEKYIFDPFFSSGVLRYSATYDSGIADGISTVNVAGSLKTSRNFPLNFVRNRYQTFDLFSAAVDMYSGATNGLIDLNPFYLSSGIGEDPFSNTINFQVSYNNDLTPNPFIDYKVDFARDVVTDTTTAQFQGVVRGRGDLKNRYNNVLAFASGVNTFNLTLLEYQNQGYQYFLNPNYISSSIVRNPFTAEVTLGASYNDKIIPPSGFVSLEYTLGFVPSIEKFSATPILDGTGGYYIVDLGYTNRSVLTLNGAGTVDPAFTLTSGKAILASYINSIANNYIISGARIVLENQSISQGNVGIGLGINFNAVWSYESPELLI